MDLSAVPIHQLISAEAAKFIIQVLKSILFPSIQPECAFMALLVKIFLMRKLGQLTIVTIFKQVIHKDTSRKEPKFNTNAFPC